MLYMPEDGVLFTGDLISVNNHPAFFEETNLKKWMKILEQIAKLDVHTVIPGHGSVGTAKNIGELQNYIQDLTSMPEQHSVTPKMYEEWSSPEIYEQNRKQLKELRGQ
jgi:cyclase